ncbi:MAG TPA: V-type ATPase subunit [Nitrososphaerales archaeon]|nr:V-type ATPase subunit [Nitrososphaerales archaeon]
MSTRIYVGTRAFALRGTILDRETVQKLAEATSLDELVNRLRSTPYSDYLSALTPPFTARRIERTLRERLAVVHHSAITGAGRYRILELYYLRHIAWDLKTALKSKALNRPYEEAVEYLDMKAEELAGRRDLIIRVLSAKDVHEAVSLLSGTEFSDDVEKALSAFTSKGEVRFFDLFLDHAVLSAISKEYTSNFKLYASSRATDVAGVEAIVANDIDAYNVLSVLRSKLWGLPEAEARSLMIVPTHRVSSAALGRMVVADSIPEAVRQAGRTYGAAGQGTKSDEEIIDEVDDGFLVEMRATAAKAFVWQGLGPGAMLALVRLLEFEVGNLAAIAIGIEARMDVKTILNRLRV